MSDDPTLLAEKEEHLDAALDALGLARANRSGVPSGGAEVHGRSCG
jgi:hypothetical protein